MRHEHENARRHAYNTLAEVNRHLDKGNIRNPRHHQMLTDMAEKATRTLNNLDTMDNTRPYTDTNIGYNADVRQRGRTSNANDMITDMMDTINRILPRVTNDMDDVDDRRGVPGTGRRRVRRVRADRYDDRYDADDRYDDRYDMDDDRYDDDMDDFRVVDMPRWRSARTGRFLPNLYGPRRVRRVRRRSEMDDMDDRYNADNRYDDYRYNHYDDRYDDHYDYARYDNRRFKTDNKRIHDAITRAAADAATETARRMSNDSNDRYNIHPGSLAMRRYDDMRYNDTDDDRRYSTRNDTRYDDATSDRIKRPGPRSNE